MHPSNSKINFVFQFAFASLKKIVRECRISWSIGVKRVIIAYIAYGSLSGQFILNRSLLRFMFFCQHYKGAFISFISFLSHSLV